MSELRRIAPVCAALVLLACDSDTQSVARMNGPVDLAVLPPGDFYEVPVGFVTNFRSGRISKLDLKRDGHLVEDGPAPWMPGPEIALGVGRALAEIALVAGPDRVDIWVSDDAHDTLLRVPYIEGLDEAGRPLWPRPEVRSIETEGPGGLPLTAGGLDLRHLRARPGRAAPEVWTITWQGGSFAVTGSVAGRQSADAVPGAPYETDHGELAFHASLAGEEPAVGTTFRVTVGRQVDEADSGGFVRDLLVDPDAPWVWVSVQPDAGPGYLALWDADAFVELGRVELPAGGRPERLAAGRDPGVLWVADSADLAGAGRIHRVDYVPGDADTIALSTLPLPEPTVDVAEGRDPTARRLFAAAAFSDAVWMLDPTRGELVDVNPITAEPDPAHLFSLVSGLTHSEREIETWRLDDAGVRMPAHGVFATTFAGELVWLDAATGCMVEENWAGAYLDVNPATITPEQLFRDVGFESDPKLVQDGVTGDLLSTHACGGISRDELWTARYDEALQSYTVEGTRSGVQNNRLYEGVRYTSDRGEISVTVLPGSLPTTEGDTWNFPINSGIAPVVIGELPGDPVVFTEQFDDRAGRWWKLREREVAVVPHVGNDMVLWIDIQDQGFSDGGVRIYR